MLKKKVVDIIIPARSGSKGIPQKNLVNLGNKPLVCWAIDVAKKLPSLRRLIVSTDHQDIADVAISHGAEVPYLRPDKISDDKTHPVHSLLYDFEWCTTQGISLPTHVFMLLPTSPFRWPHDLEKALALYCQSEAYSLVGVCDSSGSVRGLRHLQGEYLMEPENPFFIHHARRQDISSFYEINGCLYLSTPYYLQKYKTFIHHQRVKPYIMPFMSSIDIDSEEHLKVAQALVNLY